MKKSFFIAFLMLILASPVIDAITFKTISKAAYSLYQDDPEFIIYDEINYTIELPTDDNSLKSIIEKKITTNFITKSNIPFNEALDKYLYEDYSDLVSSVPESANMNAYTSINGEVKSKSTSLVVYECAHLCGPSAGRGGCTIKYINYYVPQKKDLKVSDLILSSKTTTVINILRQKAKKFKATNNYGSEEIHTKAINKLKISNDFYLSSKGITFVYQEYELGENRGYTVDLTIPKSQLTGCLTALGKKLIK